MGRPNKLRLKTNLAFGIGLSGTAKNEFQRNVGNRTPLRTTSAPGSAAIKALTCAESAKRSVRHHRPGCALHDASGRIHLQDEHGDAPTRRRQCRELNGKLHAVRSQPINTCTKDRQNSVRPARATAQRCAPHNPTRRSGKRNAATLLAQHATHHPLASVSFCAPKRHASVLYSTATD